MLATNVPNALHAGLILLGAWCCRKCGTSPNPAPEQAEQKKYTTTDPFVVPPWVLSVLYQTFYWVMNIGELAVALGVELPYKYLPTSLSPLLRPSRDLFLSSPERIIGLAMIVAGTALRIACYRHMDKNFTFELAVREGHKLVTDGPYAYVRHPAYTGSCCVIIGCLLFNLGRGSWWAVCALPDGSPWLILGMIHIVISAIFLYGPVGRCSVEDVVLREHFKEEWVQWAEKTPYRIVPLLF